jgi:hypothetical protein
MKIIRDKAYIKEIQDRYLARLKAKGFKQHSLWADDDTWNVIRYIRNVRNKNKGEIKVFIPDDYVYTIKKPAVIRDDEHGLLLYDAAENGE